MRSPTVPSKTKRNDWMLTCTDEIFRTRRRIRITDGFRVDKKCTVSTSCVDASFMVTIEKEPLLGDCTSLVLNMILVKIVKNDKSDSALRCTMWDSFCP